MKVLFVEDLIQRVECSMSPRWGPDASSNYSLKAFLNEFKIEMGYEIRDKIDENVIRTYRANV
jgi:hypothetical protein